MTPDLAELIDRTEVLLDRAFGRDSRTLLRAQLVVSDVTVKLDTGILSIAVRYRDRVHLIYVETPSGDHVSPPGHASEPGAVTHALETLQAEMVLDDLANV